MTTALALNNMSDVQSVAKHFYQSGFFTDAKSESQAVVKIMAGREMGFSSFTAMTGINIIKGRPCISANLMAAAIKRNPKYRFVIPKGAHTNTSCTIDFYERVDDKWEFIGESTFTIEDAKKAQLLGNSVWGKYPKNMLFARTISNGCRWYCSDVFLGTAVYTPEEMGAKVNEDGEVIDIEAVSVPPQSLPAEPVPNSAQEKPIYSTWTSQKDAIDWAVGLIGIEVQDAIELLEGVEPDENDNLAPRFHAQVMQIYNDSQKLKGQTT